MGGNEQFVDVSYRGLELGKGLRLTDLAASTAYLEHAAPMPVGAEVDISTAEGVAFSARVIRVHEQVAGAELPAGMRIQVDGLDAAARRWWDERQTSQDPPLPAAAEAAEAARDSSAEGGVPSGGNGAPSPQATMPMAGAAVRAAADKDGAGDSSADEAGGEDGANGRDGKRKRRRRGKKKR